MTTDAQEQAVWQPSQWDVENGFREWLAHAIAQAVQAERERIVPEYEKRLEHLASCPYGATYGPEGDYCSCGLRKAREFATALRARPTEPTGEKG